MLHMSVRLLYVNCQADGRLFRLACLSCSGTWTFTAVCLLWARLPAAGIVAPSLCHLTTSSASVSSRSETSVADAHPSR